MSQLNLKDVVPDMEHIHDQVRDIIAQCVERETRVGKKQNKKGKEKKEESKGKQRLGFKKVSMEKLSKECDDFLEFVKRDRNLKSIECAIDKSLWAPGCWNMVLIDIRITCRGPDDRIYAANGDIRRRVARGNTVLEYLTENGRVRIPLIQGMLKFTGGMGDDDDVEDPSSSQDWKKFFLKKVDDAKQIVAMDKANGEAAHLACHTINGKRYIVCGSKNVHILVTSERDLRFYQDKRYMVVVEVAKKVFHLMNELEDGGEAMFAFLSGTGLTANFEILQPMYQHVELLPTFPLMLFFTFTKPEFSGERSSLCDVHPVLGIEIMRQVGSKTVDYSIEDFSNFDEYVDFVRQSHGKEGKVLYVLDDTENVIGMLKKKTIWYVVVRAIREKIKHSLKILEKEGGMSTIGSVCDSCIARTTKRLKEIQRWLQFGDADLELWTNVATKFISWILSVDHLQFLSADELRKLQAENNKWTQETDYLAIEASHVQHKRKLYETTMFTTIDVNALFPVVWDVFLKTTETLDHA
eukprot:m.123942 g.123942  ORF g.123942 m.123942 type:complete len:524 (+) comp9417_c2_seq15:321-1892(+)